MASPFDRSSKALQAYRVKSSDCIMMIPESRLHFSLLHFCLPHFCCGLTFFLVYPHLRKCTVSRRGKLKVKCFPTFCFHNVSTLFWWFNSTDFLRIVRLLHLSEQISAAKLLTKKAGLEIKKINVMVHRQVLFSIDYIIIHWMERLNSSI